MTFHWFVEHVEISRELDHFSARYQDGLRRSVRWPLIKVPGLPALFLFQSGDDKMQWVLASLGKVITSSSTVRRLCALLKGGSEEAASK